MAAQRRKQSGRLVEGRLESLRSGAAFVIPERGGRDLFVPADRLGGACHGDRVVARRDPRRRGRAEGRVVRVLERATSAFVGTLRRGRDGASVSPDLPKAPREISVAGADAGAARDGEKVVVEILDWGSGLAPPVGRVVEALGMPGTPGLEVLLIAKQYGLATAFPEPVLAEAAALPEAIPRSEIRRRLDLRALPVVTIDPVEARDFDDALSLRTRDDGALEVGIHIADVSHFVAAGSALDEEARHRGTSVYLVDRVLPMLPEALSNGLCSLAPGVDRLALSVLVGLTPRGRVLDHRIADTVIRSRRRLTYEEVQAHFDGGGSLEREGAGIAPLLDGLRGLASALARKGRRRGAIELELPETRVELDAEGLPVAIREVRRLESHRLVEMFMLLANELVAQELRRARAPAVYRVHEEPAPAKLAELREDVARFGCELRADRRGRVAPRELQAMLRSLAGRPEQPIVGNLVLRSLARAHYAAKPEGHFALALRDYTHFTSPIRRYPDLLVHRALRVLSGREAPRLRDPRRLARWLEDAAEHASERERAADGAERDSVELKKVHYMERHLGEVFEGVVAGVEAFGVFVELEGVRVRGLVRVEQLGDEYSLREREQALVARRSRRRLALGDPVEVRVAAVRRELRQIDLELASPPPRRHRERPGRRRRRRAGP